MDDDKFTRRGELEYLTGNFRKRIYRAEWSVINTKDNPGIVPGFCLFPARL